MSAPIPVTVIGGYLGSGKTTLLNSLLRQSQGSRIAVLVNDFGEIGIDGDLIAEAHGDTITLTNGCVCCAIGSDLMTALWQLRDRGEPPDRIIVEASGVADPAPVAHHALTPGFDLDSVVVLVDAETVRQRERHPVIGRTIRRQLASADILLVTKTDLVIAEDVVELRDWIGRAAPGVPLIAVPNGQIPPAALMGLDHHEGSQHSDDGHTHDYLSRSIVVDRPLARERLVEFLDSLPASVLRVKGIVALTESPGERTVVHRVASRCAITTGGPWRPGETGRLVIIALAGTDLDRLVHPLFAGRSVSRRQ